jgi:hypothetical protein
MKSKELKALRKRHFEILQPLRTKLDDEKWHELNSFVGSLVDQIKESNSKTEDGLIQENESLKDLLAANDKKRREEMSQLRERCVQDIAASVSAVETKYKRQLNDMETNVTKLSHSYELANKGWLKVSEIACTAKALEAAKSRFHDFTGTQLVQWAIDVIAMSIDRGDNVTGNWSEFTCIPYPTQKGWCVFVCLIGELDLIPSIVRVNEHATQRAVRESISHHKRSGGKS